MTLVGLCLNMCPDKEIEWRERECLLHKFEILSGTQSERRPKADRNKMVKQFSRPAAGQKTVSAKCLRPANVLLDTVEYLTNNVIEKDDPWPVIYEFVCDRLRSVCQDMTVLRLSDESCITVLEYCVRFYIYSSFRLCAETTVILYDGHINHILLMECLKRLLVMYKDLNFTDESLLESNFPELASVYLLYNIGSPEAISYALLLSSELRAKEPLKFALDLSLAYWNQNFYKVLRLWNCRLPLLGCCLHRHLEYIRKEFLGVLNVAFSSKNCKFDISKLTDWLSTESDIKTSELCRYYGIQLIDTSTVSFSKGGFLVDKELFPSKRDASLNKKLENISKSKLISGNRS